MRSRYRYDQEFEASRGDRPIYRAGQPPKVAFTGGPPAVPLASPVRANFIVYDLQTGSGNLVVLQSNPYRNYLQVQNLDASNALRVNFGAAASDLSGIYIAPGGVEVWDVVVPINAVNVYCSVAGVLYEVVEG